MMASARDNSRRHELSAHAVRPSRSGVYVETSSEDFPSALSRRARKAAESARMAAAAPPPPPRTSSRIPHTAARPEPAQSYAWKQTLASKSRPENSSASNASGKASTRAPSVSSSQAEACSNRPRNFLRKKSRAVPKEATSRPQARNESTSTASSSSISVPPSQSSWDLNERAYAESPGSIRAAQQVEIPTTARPMTIYPELDRYRDYKPQTNAHNHSVELPYALNTTDLPPPPPTPLFSTTSSQHSAFSGSPSTRYSESPGPGSYSRDTTPTSMSSVSPGIAAPMRLPVSRPKTNSPARPPVTQSIIRRRAEATTSEARETSTDRAALASVRDSSNSSSSGSTIRATGDREQSRRKGLAAPMPAPRKSSESCSSSRSATEPPLRTARVSIGPTAPAHSRSGSTETLQSVRGLAKPAGPRAAPPRRPSRDGTSDLHSQVGLPIPVVHSNLSSTSLAERRRSGNLPATVSRTSAPLPADRPHQAAAPKVARKPTPAPHTAAAAIEPPAAKVAPRGPSRTPSPSVASAFKSRFPLFGRRNKTAAGAPSASAEGKPPRKGPAAGTGHEGYGRLGHVRRRSSNLTGAVHSIPGTMSFQPQSQSKESVASSQPSDPFLASRMSPVVIAGGEIIHSRNASADLSRIESSQSIALPRPSIGASRTNSDVSLTSREARTTLWPSALPRGATPTPSAGHRHVLSDSSDSDALTMRHTLAYRRSMGRFNAPDQEKARLPKPLHVLPGLVTPSISSYDTTLFSDDSTRSSRPRMQLGADSEKTAAKKLKKQPRSPRKWNIFGRQTASKKKQPEEPQAPAAVQVVNKPPIAFYTMMDNSEQEEDAVADVEDVLRDARPSRPASPKAGVPVDSEPRPLISRHHSREAQNTTLVDRHPEANQAPKPGTAVPASRDLRNATGQPSRAAQASAASRTPSARPSRLPQVGRIPRIETRVNAQVERPLPSPMSFSRPFNRVSLQLPSPTVAQAPTDESVPKGPSPPELLPLAAEKPTNDTLEPPMVDQMQLTPSSRASREIVPAVAEVQREFIMFPASRKVSDTPSSSDSSCSGVLSYSEATAVIPEPNAPLAEDEVWDEYNDILCESDVSRGHPSVTSSLGRPFHLEMWGRQLSARPTGPALETPIVPGDMGAQMNARIDGDESECETEFEAESQVEVDFENDCEAESEAGPHVEPAPNASSIDSLDMTTKSNDVLEAAGGPQHSPFSINGFVDGYASRTDSADIPLGQSKRFSTASSQKARVLRDSQASSNSNGSDDTSALAQVNLRVGSMTVSKWLTFGHVLFSPVRDELVPVVGSLKRHSILVIDGLGNDDWSFYAAETYPAATFFNLSPRAPLPTDTHGSGHSSFPISPPNHHQIQYKSNANKIPFGAQSFTCVVFRFPTAAPESHYRNVINEARRVLKPGGYMELSILDVDMNNMGNNARRAVRRLKERMHIRTPDISLASSSDLILRLLGRKGFADIKTCRVGVPLATAGPDTSSAASSSKAGAAPAMSGATRRSERETRTLAELMSAEGPGADESITKMVAKVGRWWYDRCYESVALGRTEKGMWQDQAMLAECEAWRTSLKLMVCHARVPDGKSRVASI